MATLVMILHTWGRCYTRITVAHPRHKLWGCSAQKFEISYFPVARWGLGTSSSWGRIQAWERLWQTH